jgi:hypothetical protein
MTLIIYKRSQRHTRFPDSRLYNNYSAFLYNLSSPQNVRYISKRLWENMNDQIVIDLDWVFCTYKIQCSTVQDLNRFLQFNPQKCIMYTLQDEGRIHKFELLPIFKCLLLFLF